MLGDKNLAESVAVGLTVGQEKFDEDEFALAMEEMHQQMVGGMAVELLEEGMLGLRVSDGKVMFVRNPTLDLQDLPPRLGSFDPDGLQRGDADR